MIFETYAQRKKRAQRGNEPEIYSYEAIPDQLRHQICLILADTIGYFHEAGEFDWSPVPNGNEFWTHIDKVCRKEIASYAAGARGSNLAGRICAYLQKIADIDDFLSVLEIACALLSTIRDNPYKFGTPATRGAEQGAEDALKEINSRFLQHCVGYQFENREFIRVDSTLEHSEIIKPALAFLAAPLFVKANADFMTAHRHYRNAEWKDSVTAAHRAFESTLKAICDKEGWAYAKGHRAPELVTLVTNNALFTHDFDRTFSTYVAMLKAGLPAVRNDAGGHGEGLLTASVTQQIARFAINMTATNIIFLADAHKDFANRK